MRDVCQAVSPIDPLDGLDNLAWALVGSVVNTLLYIGSVLRGGPVPLRFIIGTIIIYLGTAVIAGIVAASFDLDNFKTALLAIVLNMAGQRTLSEVARAVLFKWAGVEQKKDDAP